MRMDDERLGKQALLSKPTAEASWRLPKRWIDKWQDSVRGRLWKLTGEILKEEEERQFPLILYIICFGFFFWFMLLIDQISSSVYIVQIKHWVRKGCSRGSRLGNQILSHSSSSAIFDSERRRLLWRISSPLLFSWGNFSQGCFLLVLNKKDLK